MHISTQEYATRLHVSAAAVFWSRYSKNRTAVVGLSLFTFMCFISFGAPLLTTSAPFHIVSNTILESPSLAHIFGTDSIGSDIYSQVLYGGRASLYIGMVAAAMAGFLGLAIGLLAGFFGGILDDILMRTADFLIAIPIFVLAILLAALIGPSTTNVAIIIGLLSWPQAARLVRAEVLSVKSREFVVAAVASGASRSRLLFSEILPNVITSLIVVTTLQVGGAIRIESGISFLGLGDPSQPSWGFILSISKDYALMAPYWAIFPGLFILATIWSATVIGDGLNDALNPKLNERGVKVTEMVVT